MIVIFSFAAQQVYYILCSRISNMAYLKQHMHAHCIEEKNLKFLSIYIILSIAADEVQCKA